MVQHWLHLWLKSSGEGLGKQGRGFFISPCTKALLHCIDRHSRNSLQAFQHQGVGGNHLDRLLVTINSLCNYFSAKKSIHDNHPQWRSYFSFLSYFRIDIFVLLDLIGAGDMSFMKLESSTSENRHQRWLLLKLCPHSCVSGDWYDRLVTIERNLRRSTRSLSGNTIFKVHQSNNP